MSEFFFKNIEVFSLIFILIVVAIISIPLIIVAIKGELLFSGVFSKRALIFSFLNAFLSTLLLVIGSVFIGSIIADESAGSGMMMLIKLSLGIGIIFGFSFSYSVIYLIDSSAKN